MGARFVPVYRKIDGHLLKLARTESLHLPRTHEKEVKDLKQHTRFSSHPRNRKKALAFEENRYDGHTQPEAFAQVERILGHVPKICLGDRGYRGKSKIDNTRIHIPKPPRKNASTAMKNEMRKRFQRRAAIEPVIGHLKSDHRLNRNFLKGFADDQINLLMAAAAFNFKRWMREVSFWLATIRQLFFWRISPADQWQRSH